MRKAQLPDYNFAEDRDKELGWVAPMMRDCSRGPMSAMERFEMNLERKGHMSAMDQFRQEQARKAEDKAAVILDKQRVDAEHRHRRLEERLRREEDLQIKREMISRQREESRMRQSQRWNSTTFIHPHGTAGTRGQVHEDPVERGQSSSLSPDRTRHGPLVGASYAGYTAGPSDGYSYVSSVVPNAAATSPRRCNPSAQQWDHL